MSAVCVRPRLIHYFFKKLRFLNTFHAHDFKTDVLELTLNTPIIDKTSDKILFHPNNIEKVTHRRALKII